MFLEEIKIDRYGPISFQKSIHLTPFTLFFGQNEAGKSLTIDAFVKFLLAKDSSNFDKINRVDEFPHGFLIVNVEGEKIKLPEKGLLKKSSEINLEVNDFKNVFIVRSSNLEIDNSSNFFLEVTERLTGIKASVIDEIVNKIREITNLTPHNSFRDIKPFQLKTRIEKADKIIRDIDIMSDDLRSQDFDWLVQKLVGDEEKLMDINNKLSDLNNAKFRDEYNKAILALDDLVRVKKELEDYSEIKEDIKERWYDLIKDRRRINIENENDINKLEALKVEINHLKDEFNNSNNDFIILSNRLNEINRIKPHISELAEKDSNVEKIKDRKNKIFKFLAYVSVIFLVMMTISSVFFHTFIPLILSIAFLIFSLVGYFIYPLKKSKIKKLSRKLRNDLAKYGVNSDSDDVKDIEFSVQKFEEYLNMKKREIDRYQNEIEVKQKLYEEIERKINENRRRINEIDEDIEPLKRQDIISQAKDQMKGVDLLKSLAYVDMNRIGVHGWSYGGFMSLLCMTKGADYFKAGIAVAPVTNWRYYDNIYTERFMRTPQENASGYDENSPINHVKKFKGRLLLVHGTADDNVHWQNSAEFVEAMVQEGKQFQTFYYTNRNHGIYGGKTRIHLYTMMLNFLKN